MVHESSSGILGRNTPPDDDSTGWLNVKRSAGCPEAPRSTIAVGNGIGAAGMGRVNPAFDKTDAVESIRGTFDEEVSVDETPTAKEMGPVGAEGAA